LGFFSWLRFTLLVRGSSFGFFHPDCRPFLFPDSWFPFQFPVLFVNRPFRVGLVVPVFSIFPFSPAPSWERYVSEGLRKHPSLRPVALLFSPPFSLPLSRCPGAPPLNLLFHVVFNSAFSRFSKTLNFGAKVVDFSPSPLLSPRILSVEVFSGRAAFDSH